MEKHVCPVWIAYLLASPIRKIFHNPEKILKPYIKENMTVLDVGCAFGFFSLSAAKMVGQNGKVVCIDLQEEMLQGLKKRASKKKLENKLDLRQCNEDSLNIQDLSEKVDFAFAIAVVHEIPNGDNFFSEMHTALKVESEFLILEPKGHVSTDDFEKSILSAKTIGFTVIFNSETFLSRIALLKKSI